MGTKREMKLENQVINLELSKRLKELGVKQESLWYWVEEGKWKEDRIAGPYREKTNSGRFVLQRKDKFGTGWKHYSAFTCAELGEMLPTYLNIGNITYILTINRWDNENRWQISYLGGIANDEPAFEENIDDLIEANARTKMLIYLKEKKLI